MYAYCLQCMTQRCKTIARVLEAWGFGRAFSPNIVQYQRKKGVNEEKVRDLLPGYVFLYRETPLLNPIPMFYIDGVTRILKQSEGGWELEGRDYDFAMELREKDGTVGVVKMVKEGDRVRVTDPLFADYDARVVKVDYRKSRAQIAFMFDNKEFMIWTACDMLFTDDKPEKNICQKQDQDNSK